MATPFEFEIVTPDKSLFYSKDVTYVGFKTITGSMGIESRHLPVIATLAVAPLKCVFADGTEKYFAVCGGFLEMSKEKCTVLATIAEPGEDIDLARANAAKERAETRLSTQQKDIVASRAEMSLKRAIMRINVSKMSHRK